MKLFFFLWILPVTLGADTHVTCIYSDECVLPCTSNNFEIIHWYMGEKAVHSFYHDQNQLGHQHKDYKGRTSLLPVSEIKNGNISLLIRNISVQDEGRYRCYTADDDRNDEKYVVMSVKAPAKSVDITLKEDTVICTSSGVYPKPEVLWFSDPPAVEPPNTVSRTEDQLFTVTSQLKVDVTKDTYTYTCSITTKDTSYTASLKQQAASELSENEFIFECPVTKDLDYSLILNFSTTTIIKYDSKTSVKKITEQWRDKVTFHPENGTIKLSHLNKEQIGTYTCESYTAQNRYFTQTKLPSKGGETANIGLIICIIAAIIIIIIVVAIVYVIIRRKKVVKSSRSENELKSTPEERRDLTTSNGTV